MTMNTIPLLALTTLSDDQLWQMSRAGDREAFGRIVERYQALICSLAYSACGNFSRSEDLAQETFVTAWQRLDELHEPSKLRAWLCGIVRNLAANARRREQRRGGPAESLDAVAEPAATEADPAAQAVSHEEEVLLWRSLGDLPETYREPLVLFYRQGHSVAEVARSLELSEEAVKQRLSRGRSLLRDELATRVESALARTRPTGAFTAAVVAVLPVITPPSAGAGLLAGAASGPGAASAAKGVLAGISKWAILGPAIGLLIGLFSSRVAAWTARSPEERTSVLRHARRLVIFSWLMSLGLVLALLPAGKLYPASPGWILLGVLAWVAALVGTILWSCSRMEREVLRIRRATGTDDRAYGETLAAQRFPFSGPWIYQSKQRLWGLPLVAVACSGIDAHASRTRRAVGWIAIGDVAISPFLALGGLAAGPVALGAITFGFLSFSLWGVAVGVLAVGSIALGWWAFGLGAMGWKAAAGGAVVARDYALGALARAAEANTPAAKEWFFSQWFVAPVEWFLHSAHWLILFIILISLGRLWYRSRQLRPPSRPERAGQSNEVP